MCLGNPHVLVHIRKNFSSFFFFPHPLSCLHMQWLVGKVYYQTKKKKLSKPNELRPNSILFTGFLVLIRYFVSMYISFLILYQAICYHGKRLFDKSSLLLMCAHWVFTSINYVFYKFMSRETNLATIGCNQF